ncbi:glycerophosphoryl diester phosphodiesterase [Kistimonas asteriae]|uniref:glycerophosphoryl diester phosphodiesterase n=1 Tax=Kistimonas asteriae TaxID=517724 RepID=UPI001BAE376B|nr:glycerophosphoryl diester phosphodiesterase [Kistimonas asteriae]
MLLSRIIGHRGNASQAPENTLASIRKAHEAGAQWVEIDVVLLGDGNLVIHHDQSLRRCTNGKGRLLRSNLETIRKLDAGSWFSPDFAGERIPTLVEALALIQELGLGLNLEIKMHRHSVKALVEPVIATLRTHWKDNDKLILSSFSHEALLQCHALAPEFRLGHLFEKLPRNWLGRARDVNAVTIHVDCKRLREARAREVIAEGYELYCYTVNKPKVAEKLWCWGIKGIFTDRPQDFVG